MPDEVLTEFAPAQRSRPEEITWQVARFADEKVLGEFIRYMPGPVMVLNRDRQIVYANPATLAVTGAQQVQDILGLRPGEAVGCKHGRENLGGCGTTKFCRYCGAVNAILQSQQGRWACEECRINVSRGGTETALDLRVWTFPTQFNGETFTLMTIADIADEKRKVFLERIFLHDIMNTATALRGYSRLLTTGSVKPDSRDHFIQRMDLLSDRIIDEIEAHRQLVAAENGELQMDLRPTGSMHLLQQLFVAYNRSDFLAGRELRVAQDSVDVEFKTDPVLLGRVIGNMIKNAIEAALPGETVTVGCRADEAAVCFWVHNPTYMPEEVRLQVFNRSFSTKGAGRGLGTYSMKFLTERYLGGHISFTSVEEAGTTFKALYPVARPAVQE